MKPALALFLSVLMLVGSLLPQHDLMELGRLPQLLEHYRLHQQTTSDFSVGEFLALHYGTGRQSHEAQHPHEHDGLPLHDCHHTPVPVVCALPVPLGLPVPGRAGQWPVPVYRSFAARRLTSGHVLALMQPPGA